MKNGSLDYRYKKFECNSNIFYIHRSGVLGFSEGSVSYSDCAGESYILAKMMKNGNLSNDFTPVSELVSSLEPQRDGYGDWEGNLRDIRDEIPSFEAFLLLCRNDPKMREDFPETIKVLTDILTLKNKIIACAEEIEKSFISADGKPIKEGSIVYVKLTKPKTRKYREAKIISISMDGRANLEYTDSKKDHDWGVDFHRLYVSVETINNNAKENLLKKKIKLEEELDKIEKQLSSL